MPLSHRPLLLALTTALLIPAAPAAASEVHVVPYVEEPLQFSKIVYTAEAGEANKLVVSGDEKTLEFRDPGIKITAGPGCTEENGGRVTCTFDATEGGTENGLFALLGDGDDSAQIDADTFVGGIEGGDGSDKLTGGPSDDRLDGGPGEDDLNGGAGSDFINGGTGSDKIDGGDEKVDCRINYGECDYLKGGDAVGAPEPDELIGSGQDIADYQGRREPITVDLAAGTGGAAGEGDTLSGLHGAEGGRANDILRGTAEADYLKGRSGDDQLFGLAGRDTVEGNDGSDTIDAGDGYDRPNGGLGDDTFNGGPDGTYDRYACGKGNDAVIGQDRKDLLQEYSCEKAGWLPAKGATTLGSIDVSPVWPGKNQRFINYHGTCPLKRCRGRVQLWSRGPSLPRQPVPDGPRRRVGSGSFDIRGFDGSMRVRLNDLGVKLRNEGARFQVAVITRSGVRSGFSVHYWGHTD